MNYKPFVPNLNIFTWKSLSTVLSCVISPLQRRTGVFSLPSFPLFRDYSTPLLFLFFSYPSFSLLFTSSREVSESISLFPPFLRSNQNNISFPPFKVCQLQGFLLSFKFRWFWEFWEFVLLFFAWICSTRLFFCNSCVSNLES